MRLQCAGIAALGIVMVLSVVSVLEIRSATEMTKFHGFQSEKRV